MKRIRIQQLACQFLVPRPQASRSICPHHQHPTISHQAARTIRSHTSRRCYATAVTQEQEESGQEPDSHWRPESLPSPPVSSARESAKLSALHARLSLPKRLPLQTLARTLVDPTADSNPAFNNANLSTLGGDLLSYYTTEYLLAQFPRLPMMVVFAAQAAYTGPKALVAITREWGVDYAAEPGGEVDPGLLQFKRLQPGTRLAEGSVNGSGRADKPFFRRGVSSRIVYDDEFGDLKTVRSRSTLSEGPTASQPGATPEEASSRFVKALMGAVYVHGGRDAAKRFFKEHFRSRQLNMHELFDFKFPTRDLSRLCAREGFEPPIARLITETGRLSRHPVFVVGVYSGEDKLGEGVGASLQEAKTRAAAAALKGWYLYSPLEFQVPSDMEGKEASQQEWKPILIDYGEIVP